MNYYKPPATDYSGAVIATAFGLFNSIFNLIIKLWLACFVFVLVIMAFDHHPFISSGVLIALVTGVLLFVFRRR